MICSSAKSSGHTHNEVAASCREQISSPVTPCKNPKKSIATRSLCRKRFMLENRRTNSRAYKRDKSQHKRSSTLHPLLHHLLQALAGQMKSTGKDRKHFLNSRCFKMHLLKSAHSVFPGARLRTRTSRCIPCWDNKHHPTPKPNKKTRRPHKAHALSDAFSFV